MLTFVVTESGKMQAEEGEHDDCVMALAIASYVHEGKWKPVEVSDTFIHKQFNPGRSWRRSRLYSR
jgi:hypothetical protein